MLRFPVLILLALLLWSCSGPLQTTGSVGHGGACVNGDGGYQMPARTLTFSVEGDNSNPQFSHTIGTASGDGGDVYCLAYRGSGTASDQIALQIENGLLQRVYSKTIDESTSIAGRIRASVDRVADGTLANTNNTQRAEVLPDLLPSLTVDPFNLEQMVFANAALRPFGYCVYLGGVNDLFVPRWSQALCPQVGSGGQTVVGASGSGDGKLGDRGLSDTVLAGSTQSLVHTDPVDGVLYKPNLTHDLVVLRSLDPGGLGPWRLHEISPVQMPNAAPTLIARVDRGAFITRESELIFEDGVLVDAKIEKTSEVNAIVDLTVEVFNTIFSIPVQVLKLEANEAANRQRLIAANAALLNETRAYREALEDFTETEAALQSTTLNPSEDTRQQACRDGGVAQASEPACAERIKMCVEDDGEEQDCISRAIEETIDADTL